VDIYESECCCVNDCVAPPARRIAVAGVLDRHDVPFRVSTSDRQAEATVQIRDLDNVALHDREAPRARRILVTRELDDFAILVTATSSGAQTQVAMRIHNRDSPAGGSTRCEYGHGEGECYGWNAEREDGPGRSVHKNSPSYSLIVSDATERRAMQPNEEAATRPRVGGLFIREHVLPQLTATFP
jgi:hypothetical protein